MRHHARNVQIEKRCGRYVNKHVDDDDLFWQSDPVKKSGYDVSRGNCAKTVERVFHRRIDYYIAIVVLIIDQVEAAVVDETFIDGVC